MYSAHGGDVNLDDEEEIIWNEEPDRFRFLREWVVQTRKKKGLPERCKKNSYSIIGYSNLVSDADTHRGGMVTKRMFILKDYDLEEYDYLTPSEAVDPMTIRAGVEPVTL